MSSIQAEHFQSWLATATHEERLETEKWDWVVKILQTYFGYGRIPTECTFQTLVIIPKGDEYFRGISIDKVLWKALSGVVHCWIGAVI